MIKEIKSYPILLGVRGEKKKDIDTLVETIIKVGLSLPNAGGFRILRSTTGRVRKGCERPGCEDFAFSVLRKEMAMDRIIMTSMNRGAGKTSLIIGLAKSLKKSLDTSSPWGPDDLP